MQSPPAKGDSYTERVYLEKKFYYKSMVSPQQIKQLPLDSAILLLNIYSRELKAAVFTIAGRRKQPKCLSVNE